MAYAGHKTYVSAMRYQKATDRRAQENRARLSGRWSSKPEADPEPIDDSNIVPLRQRVNQG